MTQCIACKGYMSEKNWKFCSVKCRNLIISRLPRGTYKRTNMVCHTCGIIYTVRNSQAHRSKFCSKKCKKKITV